VSAAKGAVLLAKREVTAKKLVSNQATKTRAHRFLILTLDGYAGRTSKTPPDISRMETSKVPPPRSYTATRPSLFLLAP